MGLWLLEAMGARATADAVIAPSGSCTYAGLLERVEGWRRAIEAAGVPPGAVVTVEGEYGPDTVAALLALADRRAIAVPLSLDSRAHLDAFVELAEVEFRVRPERGRTAEATGRRAVHPLYRELRGRPAPGLVLFSSGSTGRHKAAVHDLERLMRKFQVARHCYRTLVFLQLDHIGGVNTLFYTLSNGGSVVVAPDRSPESVAATIERHRVELLPTSPTFLNLLLLSGAHRRHDLSSLRLVTYGTEPMPQSTLDRVTAAFPSVRLQQTYGLTEVGILRSKSREPGSLWVRVGGEGYDTKVVGGRLWVRAESAMLGYLNAPSPFDADGFFDTGDRVEVDGEWLRILGRDSDIINVGGSKVYPAEVEDTLLALDNVADVSVRGEPNPLTGQVVAATVVLDHPEALDAFKARMRLFCRSRLAPYKVPARVAIVAGPLHSSRYKRMRSPALPSEGGG